MYLLLLCKYKSFRIILIIYLSFVRFVQCTKTESTNRMEVLKNSWNGIGLCWRHTKQVLRNIYDWIKQKFDVYCTLPIPLNFHSLSFHLLQAQEMFSQPVAIQIHWTRQANKRTITHRIRNVIPTLKQVNGIFHFYLCHCNSKTQNIWLDSTYMFEYFSNFHNNYLKRSLLYTSQKTKKNDVEIFCVHTVICNFTLLWEFLLLFFHVILLRFLKKFLCRKT